MTVFTGSLTVLLACHHRAYLDVNTTTYEKIPVAWLIWLCRWALVLQHPDELDAIGSHGGRDGGWHQAIAAVMDGNIEPWNAWHLSPLPKFRRVAKMAGIRSQVKPQIALHPIYLVSAASGPALPLRKVTLSPKLGHLNIFVWSQGPAPCGAS